MPFKDLVASASKMDECLTGGTCARGWSTGNNFGWTL